MKKWAIWMILCFGGPLLYAKTEAEIKTETANQFFMAGDYQKADQEYGKILQLPLLPWQKEIALYNKGNALLAQKKWNEALSQFQQIVPSETSFPLLASSLKTNLAVTRLFQGGQLLENEAGTKEAFTPIYVLRNALMGLQDAQKADCDLQRIEGSSVCEMSENLRLIMREARIYLALAIENNQQRQLFSSSVEKGVPLLLVGIKAISQDLYFLEEKAFSPAQREAYKTWFSANAQSWLPLWESMRAFFEKASSPLFDQSYQNFMQGLAFMQKEEWKKSLESMRLAEKSLQDLWQQIWKKQPFMALLQRLKHAYQSLEWQDPLSTWEAASLLEEQKQVQGQGREDRGEALQKSTEDLAKSVSFLKEKHSLLGRFFFEEAGEELKDLIVRMNSPPQVEDPIEILKKAIEKQRFALKLNQLQQKMQGSLEDVQKNVRNRQADTVAVISLFLEAVTKMQQKETSNPFSEKEWKDILSFVGKGYQKALAAAKILQEESPLSARASSLQEQAAKDWFIALEKLKNLEQVQKQKQEKNFSMQPAEQKIKQVFKMAQEMEKSDRALRQAYTPTPLNQGEKPW
ncbi:hypothetical protein [Parachlamydia sp. AcF125]|uniref:hypothetical protein n=1 Tax=Parachlamydia sp. AcF125 TaxID=2795736 RepID=UPI001BC8DE41|nr:hypothetical protein [Parachlamydia sp. AcF125]MBS4169067.1 hypothetical protein [Parachlamydia sp. AcF125]